MKYIIANWKMNMNTSEVRNWIVQFSETTPRIAKDIKILIAPSFTALAEIGNTGLEVCAQDVSNYDKGAHTGEVGAFDLKDYCPYSIVGHSERNEDSTIVTQKRDMCLKYGITPIVCFVNNEDVKEYYKDGVILAWEDPQNISVNGVYRSKDPEEIRKNIDQIRNLLPTNAELIYGGSVNRDNLSDISAISGISGVLVGNASLDPQHFADIISIYSGA
jgi:triosephosphate isomerase (TIM)